MDSDSVRTPPPSGFRVGRWFVDPEADEIRDGERAVRLRPKAMAMLVALASHSGEVVAKESLLETVWSDVVVSDASVGVVVAELRKALGDTPGEPEYIETIPRRGYRLIARVCGTSPPRPAGSRIPSRFWLVGSNLEFVLAEGASIVGRAPDADIRVPSQKVSRRHARIVVTADAATIEDLGSKNGTFLGGVRVDGPTLLAHGNELRLGQLSSVLRVVVVGDGSTVSELSREASPTRRDRHR